MDMVNMKMKPKKNTIDAPEAAGESSKKPYYPWGLTVSLEKEALKKLNLKAGEFKLGQKMEIEAIGEVTSISQSETPDFDSENVSIQITDIAITGSNSSKLGKYNKENEKGPGE